MSGPFGSSPWGYNPSTGFYDYSIDQSLRFNNNDLAYLEFTPSSAGNRDTWTISMWVKRSGLGLAQSKLFAAGSSFASNHNNSFYMWFQSDDTLRIFNESGGSYFTRLDTTRVFRDTAGWYHIVYVYDSTQATATDRQKLYINGVEETAFDLRTDPGLNVDSQVNATHVHRLGASTIVNTFDGYMAEVNFIDGTALDATSFGETSNGVWVPKAYSGSYGTNGWYLDFSTSSYTDNGSDPDVFADQAGSNNWDAYNIAASDIVPDSPTDNYATLSSTHISTSGGPVLSEGNTRFQSSGASWSYSVATMSMPNDSGKYAWKFKYNAATSGSSYPIFFITSASDSSNFGTDTTPHKSNGNSLYISVTGSGAADTVITKNVAGTDTIITQYAHGGLNGATFEILLDTDANTITIKDKDGTARATDYDVSYMDDGSGFIPVVQAYSYNNAELVVDYTPSDSDYKLLKSSSLPEPTIGPNSSTQADDYFSTTLWTGNATDARNITTTNKPELVWVKIRGSTTKSHQLADIVRGGNKRLSSDVTNAEGTETDRIQGFGSNYFTVGTENSVNGSSNTYVGWSWTAGGNADTFNIDGTGYATAAAASLDGGDITPTGASINTTSGFSIISYTGNGSANQTIKHGLSSDPEFTIIKCRDTNSNNNQWQISSSKIADNYVYFTTAAFAGTAGVFPTSGDSTTVTIGRTGNVAANTNDNTKDFIMYNFHSVDGFCKVGKYTTNNVNDGTSVYTGFRPKFVMIKRTDGTVDWQILDSERATYNPNDKRLEPNTNAGEATTSASSDFYADFLSNGFKLRGNGSAANGGTNATVFYIAFAEVPFKYANAR